MTTTKGADAAVRDYLLFLADPAQLINQRAVEKLEKRIEAATDPLERLVAIAEHERALHPDETPYREAFVANAKAWAAARNVPPAAFEKMGVAPEVLAAAGIAPLKSSSSRRPRPHAATSSVTVVEVMGVARKMRGRFTAMDVARAAGGSPMTIRKALAQLIDEGVIRRVGPAPDWSTKGRAPIMYERA